MAKDDALDPNRRKLRKLLKDFRVAMLTTVGPDATLRARPMATLKAPFEGDLWSFTRASAPKAETRIRRGEVFVHSLDTAGGFLPPMFWGNGSWDETSGMLWLNHERYRELAASGQTSWEITLPSSAAPGFADGLAGTYIGHCERAHQHRDRNCVEGSHLKLLGGTVARRSSVWV